MDRQLRRQDVPPRPGPEIEVIRVEAGPGVRCQILSPAVWGVWTHWDGARSRECTGDDASCVGHEKGWPTRWKGYLYVWSSAHKSNVFLELTPGAAAEIIRQHGDGSSLRGLLLRLDRHGTSIRAKVSVELTPCVAGVETLPPDLSPEPILRKLWGWR